MYIFYGLLLVGVCRITAISCAISINKVVVRIPQENDIGLIFDLCVVNSETDKKEVLQYRIRSDGTCGLNLTESLVMSDASRVVGANFGFLEAGAVETVSLIWPTVSLYNRVGFCPIVVTSTNFNNEQVRFKQILHFDTRFNTLDPEGHTLRKHKDYKDCNNWDKDYLNDCAPVNCEERYFGRRNFYNLATERCDAVPPCTGPHEIYDTYGNECIDSEHFCSEEDIQMIRQGKFEENILNLRGVPTQTTKIVVNQFDEENLADDIDDSPKKRRQTQTIRNDEMDGIGVSSSSYGSPLDWLWGLGDGLLIVVATLAVYGLICFIIYLGVSWVSRRHFKSTNDGRCSINTSTPNASEESVQVITRPSLMSQR